MQKNFIRAIYKWIEKNSILLKYGFKFRKTPCIDQNWNSINYNRISAVNHYSRFIKNEVKYLEIGCNQNDLFDSVPFKNKIGVDPYSGGNIRLTSDDFFLENKMVFNLIFIDGLHTYEQLHKDINNSLDVLDDDGYILLHDMLPRNWKECFVPPIQDYWLGDCWKVSYELIESVGLDFYILNIDNGVGVIQKKNNYKVTLPDLSSKLKNFDFTNYLELRNRLTIIEMKDII